MNILAVLVLLIHCGLVSTRGHSAWHSNDSSALDDEDLVGASSDDTTRVVMSENTTIRYRNPGICETTPGVRSWSGYVDLDSSAHVFFWYFEARRNAETAPVTLWLNGGPGSDSLIGLMNGIGPCTINPDLTTKANPFSWSEASNLLFVSQPLGVGFSHLTPDVAVRQEGNHSGMRSMKTRSSATTERAAVDCWRVVQAVVATLAAPRDRVQGLALNLWTESYGGHFGPVFYKYFYTQNELVRKGIIDGIPVLLNTLGIGNGIIDGATQFPHYPEFAVRNTYGIEAVTPDMFNYMTTACHMINGCLDLIWRCQQSRQHQRNSIRTTAACTEAANMCRGNVEGPYYSYSDRNMYDIRRLSDEPAFPDFFVQYLNLPQIRKALGVDVDNPYEMQSGDVYAEFQQTGEYVFSDFIEELESLLDLGVRVLLWYGDADYIGNWFGGEAVSLALNYSLAALFRRTGYEPLEVGDAQRGFVREYSNLSFAVIQGAGHFVALDAPDVALELFRRGIEGNDIRSGKESVASQTTIPFPPDDPIGSGG